MKIALLGTGFGQAHAAVYAKRPDVDEVVVFGRKPEKLAKINEQFGFSTTTNLDAVITDPSVDLVDICLTGQGPATLTEYTATGRQPIELAAISPYAAMIEHVLTCLTGQTDNRMEPASALPALELTLDVHQRLTQAAG